MWTYWVASSGKKKKNMQEGDFEMKHIDKAGSSTFNVSIAPFSLSILGDDTDDAL